MVENYVTNKRKKLALHSFHGCFYPRLTCCKVGSRLSGLHYQPSMITMARPVTLKAIPYKEETEHDLDARNAKLGRPMSPHLSIYAYQLTSVLSISHRFTGL